MKGRRRVSKREHMVEDIPGQDNIPGAVRGRAHTQQEFDLIEDSGTTVIKAGPKVKVVKMRVIRANGDIEEIQ